MRWHWIRALTSSDNELGRQTIVASFVILIVLCLCGAMPAWPQTTETPATEPPVTHRPDVFERLWKVYPNKTDRAGAIEAWNTLQVSDAELYQMRTSFPQWRFSHEWSKEKGKNVPPLSVWLGQRMWEMEPPPQAPPTVAEISDFLIQPLYLAPRMAYAISGTIIGGLVYPWNQGMGGKILNSSLDAPWVWHEFLGGEE